MPDDDPSRAAASRPRTIVLGVLGGIAAGKSGAAAALAGPDGLVLSADGVVHELYAEPAAAEFVREEFGPECLGADGRPDRAALAARVFSDPGARGRLERWTHPRVRARIYQRLDEARAAGCPRIVLDVPLLLENDAEHGLVGLCDALVYVDVDPEERDRRAQRDRGWPPGEVARREAAQFPTEEKRARADHVLPNHGGPAELEKAARNLLARHFGEHSPPESPND